MNKRVPFSSPASAPRDRVFAGLIVHQEVLSKKHRLGISPAIISTDKEGEDSLVQLDVNGEPSRWWLMAALQGWTEIDYLPVLLADDIKACPIRTIETMPDNEYSYPVLLDDNTITYWMRRFLLASPHRDRARGWIDTSAPTAREEANGIDT